MPRIQVYLPDALYRAVKKQKLPASELLQAAVRAELRRRELVKAGDKYLEELLEEVGEPSAESLAEAEAIVKRVRRASAKRSA